MWHSLLCITHIVTGVLMYKVLYLQRQFWNKTKAYLRNLILCVHQVHVLIFIGEDQLPQNKPRLP